MGKCSHRVSDHMTGSAGFDSSWERRGACSTIHAFKTLAFLHSDTWICDGKYTLSIRFTFRAFIQLFLNKNLKPGYFGSVMGIVKFTG